MSRSDISYAVNNLAQLMEKPKEISLDYDEESAQILITLSGTQCMEIVLRT